MDEQEKIGIFEDAFATPVGHSSMECEGGKIFYNSTGDWDWDEGELEKLMKSENAIDLDYSVGEICFEGRRYALDCKCWHTRAMVIFEFLMAHNHPIVKLFTNVKALLLKEAENIKVKQPLQKGQVNNGKETTTSYRRLLQKGKTERPYS